MSIEIEYEKLLVFGNKYRKITGLKMFGENDLPKNYFHELPVCVNVKDEINIFTKNSDYIISKDDILSERTYQNMLSIIKECGAKLHKINKENEWEGEGVDKI